MTASVTERPAGADVGPAPSIDLVGSGETAALRRDLETLAAGSTRWMADTVGFLSPDFPDLPVTPKVKASLELALLHRLWARARPGDPGLRAVDAAVRQIWADPRFPGQIGASPAYRKQYGLVYAAFAPPGITSTLHAELSEELHPGGRIERYGRSPHLHLELRYFADIAGLRHDFASYADLYGRTELASLQRVDVPIDPEQAYRATHVLFQLTDCGAHDAGLPAADRARVLRLIDAMTDYFVWVEYWDIVAELAFSQFLLGTDPTTTRSGAAAIRCLLDAQLACGALPGRHAAQRLDETAEPLDLFRRSFHTTLVTAFFAVTVLAAQRPGGAA